MDTNFRDLTKRYTNTYFPYTNSCRKSGGGIRASECA
ncbi:MAG: hypothetical protein F4Y82_00635 [Cenarchaeum sp. SB0665_bin_23]|nr:hypothetical protein [Cenarchaeum sp. SB0667_bin_13]MXY60611.1 hypothetical protein [Cenarchaeum sp. SB0665_bin_23]MYB47350.1 hypothetical protein [Cenarchaeum sp. SB0662_bin_33]MYC79378.1 hypothetical protein [Cenarchaeum sp. SB0661_bin_35]MYG33652.1 hypothetical protein [Cenarchaeum sp. SB0677_bin_16]